MLVAEARRLGYYSNLITSGIGMDADRVARLKEAGLDHIQISFQASDETLNDFLGGTQTFQHKRDMARAVKAMGYPMVLNIVIHRRIRPDEDIIRMTIDLQADYVELASTQHGWSSEPKLAADACAIERAEAVARSTRPAPRAA